MMTESIYEKIILSKTNVEIPLLKNGCSLESRYNPEREADQLLSTFTSSSFFLIFGLGSGLLINKITEKIPGAKILVLEKSSSDFDFLQNLKEVKKLSSSDKVIFTWPGKIRKDLLENYLPALYGSIKIHENRNWMNYNADFVEDIQAEIKNALQDISRDFSVQAHFGKIWQKNIINNLSLISDSSDIDQNKENLCIQKKAAVIAAGPSLDEKINLLSSGDYYIIASDTAFSSLQKRGIIADAVVSIDAQKVSADHFFSIKKESLEKTTFYFDLCGNFSAAKKIKKMGGKVSYFISGHPLSSLADNFLKNHLQKLYSGSGTVTISALDLALQKGFSQIEVFAADFSYPNGKPYARGTYLDSIYSMNQTRLNSREEAFSRLMFRTPLVKTDMSSGPTSQVLQAYRKSFEDYLRERKCDFFKENDIYYIQNNKVQTEDFNKQSKIKVDNNKGKGDFYFDRQGFLNEISSQKYKIPFFLLPYIAWLRKNSDFKEYSFEELCKMAQKSLQN